MNVTYRWKCNQCGKCCIDTVVKTDLGKFGVFLLPHERILFPEQHVKPLFGVGMKGDSRPRPKIIFAYQNISKPCVWYEPELNECMIYPRRPLSCMEFPLSQWHGGMMLHRECPQIAKMIPENVMCTTKDLRGLETEFKAVKKMATYFMGIFILNIHNVNLEHAWAYNLDKNKWEQWKNDRLIRYMDKISEKVKAI